jgi:hypothetical protein
MHVFVAPSSDTIYVASVLIISLLDCHVSVQDSASCMNLHVSETQIFLSTVQLIDYNSNETTKNYW